MARILVIDDENNIRMMVRLTLQHVGYEVDVAADGQEGLARFNDGSSWDLILLDQRMPFMDGLDVLRQIRYQDPSVKIIMITAFGTIDLAVEAMKAGATDFLRKPFTGDILRGAVQAALKGTGAAGENAGLETSTPSLSGPTFGLTTINGYRIEFKPGPGIKMDNGRGFVFSLRSPHDALQQCTVVLSNLVMELVKAHTDREEMPGGSRFWQAICEEALANYLWQNAEFPPDGLLRVAELTSGLRRFVDSVLAPH